MKVDRNQKINLYEGWTGGPQHFEKVRTSAKKMVDQNIKD